MQQIIQHRLALLALFTFAHLVVTLGCILLAFAETSAWFDNPQLPRRFYGRAAGMLAEVLTSPGRFVWELWAAAAPGRSMPNTVEWLVFVSNSALWGVLMLIATTRLLRWRRAR